MDRIDKILANHGYCSRRGAERFLRAHRITFNNVRLFDTSQKVEASGILIDDQQIDHPDGIFILMHKPSGYVCSHDSSEGPRVYDLLPPQWMNRNPVPTSVGRLDKDTTGALIITDNMDLVHRLTSPSRHVSKVYHITVDKKVSDTLIETFRSGTLQLNGEKKPCLPAKLELIDSRNARLTLEEGKYHQVKKMFASQGYTVVKLHRQQFGEWNLEGLDVGCWKDVEPEFEHIRANLGLTMYNPFVMP
jgi:16S rRNA pseudouridine516 synthase